MPGIKELPDASSSNRQRTWDTLVATASRDRLLDAANQLHRARLLAASQPHTAAWLQAVPVPNLGLHLDEESVRVAVALRLGAAVCAEHACRLCGRKVDALGHHGLSCLRSAGRLPRHAHLNEVVRRGLVSAGIPAILEPVGLDRGDGKRPDGLTLFPYSGGMCLIWDATCTDTFADSALIQAALEPGAAASAAEARKIRHYSSLSSRYKFTPVAAETSGVLGPATSGFIKELGRLITARTGDRRETEWLLQRLSIAIVRGNAASVLATAATARAGTEKVVLRGGAKKTSKPTPPPSSAISQVSDGRAASTVGTDESSRSADEARPTSSMPTARSGSFSPPGESDCLANKGDIRQRVRTLSRASQYVVTGDSTISVPAGVTGLENLGNTCYMNAVLQVLAQTQSLANYMASEFIFEDLNSLSVNHGQVATEVVQLLEVMRSRKFGHVSPHRFLTVVSARHRDFGDMCMHDAHEFTILLLEWLHDDLNVAAVATAPPPATPADGLPAFEAAENVWRQFQRVNNSIVTRLFYGLQKSTLLCTACGFESATFETFSLLSLPLAAATGGHRSLYHCLDQYVCGDLITDWTCPKCRRRHDAYKKLDLWRLPPVIILHLKRFSFANNTARKDYAQVAFPLRDLDLSQLAIGPHPGSHSMVYDLYGVVEHHGSQHSGHYTAFCFNQAAASWFSTNDTIVRESTAARVKDATAYLLCYSVREVA